ncbi:hypothetical protein RB597_001041 [Gaeumannomyces tritici]
MPDDEVASIRAYGPARSTVKGEPLSKEELEKYNDTFKAAMYLCLGMIYLRKNPLLREPLALDQIKGRLLGHFGSTPGQAFTWMHFNRLIKKYDLDSIFISGPGHGAPAVLAMSYIEGVYSEVYPDKSEDEEGLQNFFGWFSFPGGIGSHATPETPGSIHEGGELGYSVSHAFGAVFDHPNLIALTMVGDGEAETGPLAAAWHSTKFLNPIVDGAVLPVLHLNGYKINNPTLLARISHRELECLFIGYGWQPYFVEGDEIDSMQQAMAATLEHCVVEIRKIQEEARTSGKAVRPLWPMIVLRTPKGWTGPRKIDDKYMEGYWRAHQVPITDVRTNPAHLKLLEEWMRSYEPERLFDANGKLDPSLKALCPTGTRRMSANPITNAGAGLRKPLRLPDFRNYQTKVDKPGAVMDSSMQNMAGYLRDVVASNPTNFRLFGPDETESNKLGKVYEAGKKVWLAESFDEDDDGGNLATEGRVMEILSEHTCEGWLEGYTLTGRHGLLNSYEPFIHVIDSMVNQAVEHCTKGIGIWPQFSTDAGEEPDIVMASCGDISTHETLAAIDLLLQHFPDLKVRYVNVVDLFKLISPSDHPHGLTDSEYISLFTKDKHVIFNFHSYPWLVHRLTYKRPGAAEHLHVRGYKEKGNIDTPLALAIRNQTDRFSLAIDAIDRMAPTLNNRGSSARQTLLNAQISARNQAFEDGVDPDFLSKWTWKRNGLWDKAMHLAGGR